ncbi:glycosyltransferase family 2 protein [Pontibacter sp. H249]|uniref:glycosyltransferase family 2 protein n=1 Tax=Pontibacter sp. H249 TaxID=3133420 RepID=UPI0030C16B50
MKPLVTVLMPAYNAEEYISDSISSILNQSFSNFDLMIINDASTDNTEKIILSFTDKRIKYYKNEKNLRLVSTLNKGLDLISTPYVARMDADDLSHPKRLEKLFEHLTKNPAVDFLSSSLELFGSEKGIWSLPLSDDKCKATLLFRSCLNHAASIYKKSFLDRNNLRYRENHIYMEDYDLWYRAFRQGAVFKNIDDVLYSYRREEHNVSILNRNTSEQRLKSFYKEILRDYNISATSYELDLHCRLRYLNDLKVNDIKNYKLWLELLTKKNNDLLLYPKQALQEVISEEWRMLYYYICDHYPELISTYFRLGGVNVKQLYYLFKLKLKN